MLLYDVKFTAEFNGTNHVEIPIKCYSQKNSRNLDSNRFTASGGNYESADRKWTAENFLSAFSQLPPAGV